MKAGNDGQGRIADRIYRCRQEGKGRMEKQTWIERCRQAVKGRMERRTG